MTNSTPNTETGYPSNPYTAGGYPDPGQPAAQTAQTAQTGQTGPTTRRRLTRTRADKMLAGVCGGAAAYFGVDATLMRLLFVAATVFSGGAAILLYLAGWWLMPQA